MQVARKAAEGLLQVAMSLVLLIVLNNMANSKFAVILGWAAWQGVRHVVIDKKYNHLRYFRSFLATCAECLLRQQLKQIHVSPYCSLLLDNSTDKSNEEHCLLYIRYMDMEAFEPKTEYLCTVKLFAKTGFSMFQTVKLVFAVLGIQLAKVTGLCTDGDAAMVGHINGLRGHLQKENPYLLSAHCAAHKSSLVMSDVSSIHGKLTTMDLVLRDTHNFFNRSPKRFQMWKRYAENHGLTATKFPMFNTTRWFSRAQCITVMLRSLPMLIQFLSKPTVQKALDGSDDLLDKVCNPEFVMVLHGVADVIEPVEIFRKYFQHDDLLPHAVKGRVDVTCEMLDALVKGNAVGGQHMEAFLRDLKASGHWTSRPLKGKPAITVHLKGGYDKEDIKQFMRDLVSDVKSFTRERFPDADVLDCFQIFDPKSYKDLRFGVQLDEYGKSELLTILKHLGNGEYQNRLIDLSLRSTRDQIMQSEFPAMKQALWSRAKDSRGLKMTSVWGEFRGEGRERIMPHMFILVTVGLLVPLNTACVERGFSHHGIIKNKLRNALKVIQMDSLLRVKHLCSSYEEFDYEAAADLHDNMQDGLISKLANQVDQLQFSQLDEESDEEVIIDFEEALSDSDASVSEYAFSASDLEEDPFERDMELSDDEQAGQSIISNEEDDYAAQIGF